MYQRIQYTNKNNYSHLCIIYVGISLVVFYLIYSLVVFYLIDTNI